MKNFHLFLISLVTLFWGLKQGSPLIWIPGVVALTYSLIAYIIFLNRDTVPRIRAEIIEVKDGNFSHFLAKIHAQSSYVYFSYYLQNDYASFLESNRAKYTAKSVAERAANEYILKHLNPEGRKTMVVSSLDPQNKLPALNLPPTAEALAKYVNEMSDEEYASFSNLLEKDYPLRKREEVLLLK